ncbi:MAG: TolC family outer membrane protein [Aestuariivita sp.]|nr:TolC family outer membrane protein [Aestuariivita sp.]
MNWQKYVTSLRVASLALVGSIVVHSSVLSENLADALVGAYENSGLLEQNRALLRAADEDVAGSLTALRPILDFSTGLSRTLNNSAPDMTSRDLNLTANWLLWDNNRAELSIQAAKETVLATRASLLSIEQQVLFRAVKAYMDVIRSKEFVALRQSNVRLLQEELRAAQDRFDVGEVTRTDVALAEARLAQARSNLATEQGNLENMRQEYRAAVGREPGTLRPPPSLPARPTSIADAQSVAVRSHPDIQMAQHQLAAAEKSVHFARASLGPTLSFQSRLSSIHSDMSQFERDNATVALNFSQRLYQGGALSSRLRRVIASRDGARANLLTVQKRIRQNVASAMVRFNVAEANIEASERQVSAAEVAFRGVREEASLGARTTLDVLDAEQELLDAKANLIAAQSELNVASYQILVSQGSLTVANLGLGVEIYDPNAYYERVKDAPALWSERGRQLDRLLQNLDQEQGN